MMKYKILLPLLFLTVSVASIQAQIKFKLQLLNDGITYQVSLVPETSYRPPLNTTSTAQVTIKVPSGSFEVRNLTNLQPHVEWEANSVTEAPEEAKESDYISFGLATNGTEFLRYEAGIELPLFTFENVMECTGEVSLMNNEEDNFMPPNSARKNVGNQITIMGADGDAYAGNLVKGGIPCGNVTTDVENIDRLKVNFDLYPNPASKNINVSLNWTRANEEVALSIYNVQGKQVSTQKMKIQNGNNLEVIDVSNLAAGTYLLEMRGADWKLSSEQFVKLDL